MIAQSLSSSLEQTKEKYHELFSPRLEDSNKVLNSSLDRSASVRGTGYLDNEYACWLCSNANCILVILDVLSEQGR